MSEFKGKQYRVGRHIESRADLFEELQRVSNATVGQLRFRGAWTDETIKQMRPAPSVGDVWVTQQVTMKIAGSHDDLANSAFLRDNSASFGIELVGSKIKNTTDGSDSLIYGLRNGTDPDTELITDLGGGTDNDWDVGDAYEIVGLSYMYVQLSEKPRQRFRIIGKLERD